MKHMIEVRGFTWPKRATGIAFDSGLVTTKGSTIPNQGYVVKRLTGISYDVLIGWQNEGGRP